MTTILYKDGVFRYNEKGFLGKPDIKNIKPDPQWNIQQIYEELLYDYEKAIEESVPFEDQGAIQRIIQTKTGWTPLPEGSTYSIREKVEVVNVCTNPATISGCKNETCWDLEECQAKSKVARIIEHPSSPIEPEKPDFENIVDNFMESFAFQVPYNGTNDFYNEERLKLKPIIEPELRKIFNQHILPARKRISELEKERNELAQKVKELEKEIVKRTESAKDFAYYMDNERWKYDHAEQKTHTNDEHWEYFLQINTQKP